MKSPKGFAKRYFTFASILAHAVIHRVESNNVKMHDLLHTCDKEASGKSELCDSLLDITTPLESFATKGCHCNYYYRLKSVLSLKIYIFIPRCPYYTTYFAFRRTGVHPPF